MFDHLLYTSFAQEKDSWLMKNYEIDHDLKTARPGVLHYRLQSYILKFQDRVLSGITFNFNNDDLLQIEKMGFSIPKSNKTRSCEIIHFFSIEIPMRNAFFIGRSGIKLERSVLKSKNLEFIYATCASHILTTYIRFGWRKVDEIKMEGSKRLYLIQYNYERAKKGV